MNSDGFVRRVDRGTRARCVLALTGMVAVHLALVVALRAGPPAVPGESEYHPIAVLDRPPAPLTPPDDCYPHGATGEVTYELLIDASGSVASATIVAVMPEGLFTAAAAELCARLRFTPAVKDGRAVKSRVRFVVAPG